MANYSGIHTPTKDIPSLFEYPTAEVCTLIADGRCSNELGCPHLANSGCTGQSCSHGLDSYICEYAKK